MYTVYKHTAPGGKVYIGLTGKKPAYRWNNGEGYSNNSHFYRAIKLYGWENIQHEIIAEGLTLEQAAALEIELIAKYDSANPDKGYNSSTGGECSAAGIIPSEESRQKRREAMKGRRLSPEHRQKLKAAAQNMSAEHRQKLSEKAKGRTFSAETRQKLSAALSGENSPNYGKHLSAETRQKIGEKAKGRTPATKGKPRSAETRQKISIANTGKTHSAETRQRLSESHKGQISAQRKPVICLETGAAYKSIQEASDATGANSKHIGSVCNGKRKTAGGYHWKYI